MGRDTQMLCKNLSISGGLVEHIDEVGVFKDILNLPAAQKVFDILRDAGGDAAPFTESLPDFYGIGCCLFLLQQQVELVHVVAGSFLPQAGKNVIGQRLAVLVMGEPYLVKAVFCNTVPDLILDDVHTDLFKLLAQLPDVIADNTVFDIHIGAVIEHRQRTGNIDFQRRGDVLCFLFCLLPELVVQVLQNRHILRSGIVHVLLIYQPHTTVNDGLFHGGKTVFAADDQFAQGQNEVGFQRQRIIVVAVIEVQVHGIDVMGRSGRDFDNLSTQPFHQWCVFSFGIADDDVILRNQESVGNFTLCGEGLTAVMDYKAVVQHEVQMPGNAHIVHRDLLYQLFAGHMDSHVPAAE